MLIPRIERGQHPCRNAVAVGPAATRGAADTRRLQQGGPLLEYPLVVGPHAGEPRRADDQEIVQEPSALAGISLDEGEVLGSERYGLQGADDLPRLPDRRPVEPGPVGAPRVDLEFDKSAGRRRIDLNPDDGTFGALAHERRIRRGAVTAERGRVANRLDQVRLPVAVG